MRIVLHECLHLPLYLLLRADRSYKSFSVLQWLFGFFRERRGRRSLRIYLTNSYLNRLYHRLQRFSMKSRGARWNPHFVRMKSASQMKLNPSLSPDEVGFHHGVISPIRKGGFSWKEPTLVVDKCGFFSGDPDEIRTRVTAVKGRCLRPLDHRAEYGGDSGTWTYDTAGMNRVL